MGGSGADADFRREVVAQEGLRAPVPRADLALDVRQAFDEGGTPVVGQAHQFHLHVVHHNGGGSRHGRDPYSSA